MRISDYLKEDSEQNRSVSILNNEMHYQHHLSAIEVPVVEYFMEFRGLLDNTVQKSVLCTLYNMNSDIKFFDNHLTHDLFATLCDVLEESPLTKNEFLALLTYIIEVIDNRSLFDEKQGYVKWLAYFFDLYTLSEKKRYEEEMYARGDAIGVSQEHMDIILLKM